MASQVGMCRCSGSRWRICLRLPHALDLAVPVLVQQTGVALKGGMATASNIGCPS